MKKVFKILIIVVLVIPAIFLFTACNKGDFGTGFGDISLDGITRFARAGDAYTNIHGVQVVHVPQEERVTYVVRITTHSGFEAFVRRAFGYVPRPPIHASDDVDNQSSATDEYPEGMQQALDMFSANFFQDNHLIVAGLSLRANTIGLSLVEISAGGRVIISETRSGRERDSSPLIIPLTIMIEVENRLEISNNIEIALGVNYTGRRVK